MANKLNVQVIVGLVDRLSRPLKGLSQNLRRTGMAMTTIGTGMAAAFAPAIKAFAEAEDAATRMELAAMRAGGVTPGFFKDMSDLATQLGDRLPGTTADFQRMMGMLQRQGLSAETILGGTAEAAANLAVMLQMTPEAAAEFTAKLQDATGTAAKDMLALTDVIQRSYYAGVDPTNMLAAYAKLAPAMGAIKQQGLAGAQGMAPLIALLDQASLTGESAGNALRKVFQGAFGKSPKAEAALAASGMNLTKNGEFLGLENMLRELQKLAAFSTDRRLEILGQIWGDDAETLQALNVMIDKGSAGLAEMSAKMREQASLDERMSKLLTTLTNLWDAASGTFTNVLAAIGQLLSPEIKGLVDWFGGISAKIREWIAANPELARTIGLVVAALTGLTIAAGALALAAGVLGAAMGILLSPVTLTVVAIGLLAAGFLYFRESAVQAVVDAVFWIQGKFEELMTYLSTLKDRWLQAGRDLIDGLWLGIQERWESLKAKVKGIADSITGIFRSETETHSPSRVFARLGTDLMRGLEVGIAAGSKLPLAQMRAATLGLGVAAMPMGATAGHAAGVTINQTITIQAPAGSDAAALAALVRREVAGATRAAVGRAALYDGSDGM